MKSKLFLMITVVYIFFWTSLSVSAEESALRVSYPHRTFIYVVDCSGSMGRYREGLENGKQMILELLPEDSTTVIAFNGRPKIVKGTLSFGGETSVLAAIRFTDETIKELWENNPEEKITIILFSDMHSTVLADDGRTHLNEDTFQTEQSELDEIEKDWVTYIDEGVLNFYSLGSLSEEREGKTEAGFVVDFEPSSAIHYSSSKNIDIQDMESAQEIMKACVQAYACALTGGDAFQWETVTGMNSEDTVTIPLKESYRTFLYFPEAMRGIQQNKEFQRWNVISGKSYMIMLSNLEDDLYTFTGVEGTNGIMCLNIPQPRIVVELSSDHPMCYDEVKISVGVTDGNKYLGYDTTKSNCAVEVVVFDDERIWLPIDYNEIRECYEVSYQPEQKGSQRIEINYTLLGTELINRKVNMDLQVEPYRIKLTGEKAEKYRTVVGDLQYLHDTDDEYVIVLSEIYVTDKRRLEFTVEEADAENIAVWDKCSDDIGKISIKPVGVGDTELRYTIYYYDKDTGILDNLETKSIKIQVTEGTSSGIIRVLWIILGAVFIVGLAGYVIYYIRRKN